MRIILYGVIIGLIVWFLVQVRSERRSGEPPAKPRFWKRKKAGRGVWVQVYDSDSRDEVLAIQARLEEEEVECLVYEQGRKDVHGNFLKGYGISVPRDVLSRAQNVVSRMIV
jgi:hypothetical protein